jgi:IS30 family transposase
LLQKNETLVYGVNIKSITTDNGSEFWDWKGFSKSIHNVRDNIQVFFCHPYHSWEKGGVENFNGLIRRKFPKGTDFGEVTNFDLQKVVDEINNLFRPSLGYFTANEIYNMHVPS